MGFVHPHYYAMKLSLPEGQHGTREVLLQHLNYRGKS